MIISLMSRRFDSVSSSSIRCLENSKWVARTCLSQHMIWCCSSLNSKVSIPRSKGCEVLNHRQSLWSASYLPDRQIYSRHNLNVTWLNLWALLYDTGVILPSQMLDLIRLTPPPEGSAVISAVPSASIAPTPSTHGRTRTVGLYK